ncbi:hypothetical protein M2138_002019 [Dysgonomonadaceae bacterium PH5-43]|nr:hypothetical protein [Dysgonomonadaceae bacterium PH5-43]
MNIRFFIIIITFLFTANSLFAQKIKVSGTVSDPDGLPIELAYAVEKGANNGAMTDEKGRYSFSVTKKDSIVFIFRCMGYSKTEIVVKEPQEDLIINARLRPQSYELHEVTITHTRPQTNTMEKLEMGQGSRLSVDASGGSVEAFVMTAGTGVSSTNELSTQYSVRGGSYNENIVYVNNIEVYRPLLIRSGQQEGLSFINPDMTESVNFSSGGFSAQYGDKMSSVLDVTYKKPTTFEGGASASMLGGNVYVGSTTGKFSQITGFRYKRGTTLLKTLDTKGDYDPSVMDLQTYMNYYFSEKLKVSFMANYSDNIYDFNPGNRETSYGTFDDAKKFKVYYDGMERDRFKSFFGAGTIKYNISENADIALQLSGFQSQEEETYDITGEYWISNVMEDSESNIGTGLFHKHARDYLNSKVFNAALVGNLGINHNSIRWSLGIQKESIKDRISEWELRDSLGYSIPYNENLLKVYKNLYSANDISSTRIFGYIQDTYKFRIDAGLFTLTAGIRGSYWNYNKEFVVSPRASLGFIPAKNQNFTFRFATGLYYQTPFYKEFRVTESDNEGNQYIELNKNIKSQRSIHFVLGGDYDFRVDDRPFKFTTEIYYKKLDDLVPYTVDNVRVWYYGKNVSDGYTIGIDTKLFGQFVPGTDSWLGFSIMEAKQKINGEKVPLPTDQRFNVTLYYTDVMPQYDKIQLNLRALWSHGLPFSVPGNEYTPKFRAPNYMRVDIGMTYKLWGEDNREYSTSFLRNFKNIWLGVDVFNLFNIGNVNSYSWFADVNGYQHAVPDKLTGRQINFKVVAEF